MKLPSYIVDCMSIFSNSFINYENELILVPKTNLYCCLNDVYDEVGFKIKLLEWCSRDAFKTNPYASKKRNNEYHNYVLNGINSYLKTNFQKADISLIYQQLGNGVNHSLAKDFILSNYDLNILNNGKPKRALGYDMQESIALFAQWEKAGITQEIAFSSMKKAISIFSKAGKDAKR